MLVLCWRPPPFHGNSRQEAKPAQRGGRPPPWRHTPLSSSRYVTFVDETSDAGSLPSSSLCLTTPSPPLLASLSRSHLTLFVAELFSNRSTRYLLGGPHGRLEKPQAFREETDTLGIDSDAKSSAKVQVYEEIDFWYFFKKISILENVSFLYIKEGRERGKYSNGEFHTQGINLFKTNQD